MPHLSLSLFGGCDLTLDGQPLSAFRTQKASALLSYLAVERARPHTRERLAGLLWHDLPEAAARDNLRGTLYQLRLPEPIVSKRQPPVVKQRTPVIKRQPTVVKRQPPVS